MSYENAPATILLAAHCCCCNRPLVDAESVTRGVGPDCAEKYGFNVTIDESARVEANAIVHRIAADPKASTVEQDIASLRGLGLAKLADRLVERLCEEPTVKITVDEAGAYVVKTPYDARFVETLKAAVPFTSRGWNKSTKTWTVAADAKAGLWSALSAAFAGKAGLGPKGRFIVAVAAVAAAAAPAPVLPASPAADASDEPPADCLNADGSVDCAKWFDRIEAEVAAESKAAPAPVANFTRAEGSFSRDRSLRGYKRTITGAYYKPSRWIGGYNA